MTWLHAAGKTTRGEEVTYTRKDGREATLTAVPGETEAEQTFERSLVAVVRNRDVLIAVSEFETAFGDGEKPIDGDLIEWGSERYAVRPLGGGPATETKASGVWFRVHLKVSGKVP
jgi:hypothetical protein